MLLYKQ